MGTKYVNSKRLLIHDFPENYARDLRNAANRKGITVTRFIKDEVKALLDELPAGLKQERPCEPCQDSINVKSLSHTAKKELKAVATNLNIGMASLVKLQVIRTLEKMEPWQKQRLID